MGIERKSLTIEDSERIKTAIHEAGHALVCHFTPKAKKLYKATIVARGGSLGATYMEPDDSEVSMNKEQVLAELDVAMGGHVAERLVLGELELTSGCGGDLQGATQIAYSAVRQYGMFGEEGSSFISSSKNDTSDAFTAEVDAKVKQLLDDSFNRVVKLLTKKDKQLRDLSKNLFWFDYLDREEMIKIIDGGEIDKERVRNWEAGKKSYIKF